MTNRHPSRTRLLCALLLLLTLAGAQPIQALASGLQVVRLMYFRATEQDGGVLLEWATGSETDTVGFRVERSEFEAGPYTELDVVGFVPATGDGFGGGIYSELDSSASTNGGSRTYWYRLVEVDTAGGENREAPVSVSVGRQDEPVADPTATSTPEPTASTLVATPSPTGQPSPESESTVIVTPSTAQLRSGVVEQADEPPATPAAAVIAQAGTPESTEAYPVQVPSEQGPSFNNELGSYPAPAAIELPATTAPSPVLETFGAEALTAPAAAPSAGRIGSGLSAPEQAVEAAQQSQQPAGPILFLWLGFLASLLIFAAGVVGAALFFTRQRTRGS